jgi:hypothetical protein
MPARTARVASHLLLGRQALPALPPPSPLAVGLCTAPQLPLPRSPLPLPAGPRRRQVRHHKTTHKRASQVVEETVPMIPVNKIMKPMHTHLMKHADAQCHLLTVRQFEARVAFLPDGNLFEPAPARRGGVSVRAGVSECEQSIGQSA